MAEEFLPSPADILDPILPEDVCKHPLLLNSIYIPPEWGEGPNGKIVRTANDYLFIVYRDLDTREKKMYPIEKPYTNTYIAKPAYRGEFRTQRLYREFDKLDKYSVPYAGIAGFIRNKIHEDGRDVDYLSVIAGNTKEAFKWRNSYFADYDIRDYAYISYMLNNKEYRETGLLSNTNVSKAFMDIESDIYGLTNAEADAGEGPINAVSIVVPYDEYGVLYKNPKVYTFLLIDFYRYKDQKYLMENFDKFISECHEEFDEKYNTPDFIINFYDTEVDLLKALFSLIHKVSPDFICIWN